MQKMNEDTAKIQKLLDGCGEIKIPGGVYNINTPLVIHDNTKLSLSYDTTFRLCDEANCQIILNDGLAERYNKNILVEGGIWDGNNAHQTRKTKQSYEKLTAYDPNRHYGIMMRFVGMDNFTLRDLTMKDPESYPVQISMVRDFTVENIVFDYNMSRTNMDGIHINGPAHNGLIRNIKGSTNDDMVALNCDDCYETEITHGPIDNILVDGLWADNGYTAVRLLSCGSPLSNVIIKNIFGKYQYNAVSFTHHNVHAGECSLDNVTIDGVYASKLTEDNDYALFWFAEGTHTGRVTIKNVHRIEKQKSVANTIKIDKNTTIKRLVLDDVTQRFEAGKELELIKNSGSVDELIIK